jgi:hypothetical protein
MITMVGTIKGVCPQCIDALHLQEARCMGLERFWQYFYVSLLTIAKDFGLNPACSDRHLIFSL